MKKLLIVVDYQNDFVCGSLGFEKAKTLENGICEKVLSYKTNGDDIAFTLDTHTDEYLNTSEGKFLPICHCVEGQWGHELYGRVKSQSQGFKLIKKSSFGGEKLFEFLQQKHFNEIEIVGIVTNICVISNAIIAQMALPEATIIVDAALCASNNEELHEKALDVMSSLNIKVINR